MIRLPRSIGGKPEPDRAIRWAVLIHDTAAVYSLSVLTCGLASIGYAATRLVPFPMLADDVGNWGEPLGIVSIISEAVVVIAAVTALVTRKVRAEA